MATRQGSQSNAMLYSLITFVALFIAATVCAVIFYVKSEEYRTNSADNAARLEEVVSRGQNLSSIVGQPESGKTYIGTMQSIVNDLYQMIMGKAVPENTPATVMLNEISMAVKNALIDDPTVETTPVFGPDGIAILRTVEDLKQKLQYSQSELANFKTILQDLQDQLKTLQTQSQQRQNKFLADLNQFQTGYNQVRDRFDELQKAMQNSTDEQLQAFQDRLETEQARLRQKQLDLQETESKLANTSESLDSAMARLEAIKSKPNNEVEAYKADAQIVRVDLQNGIVYLDAGRQDHIYLGLTFAVFDRNLPIPENGEGKAEIEVFRVNQQACAARIIKSDKNNPIVKEDIVANLIWDSKNSNRFVVVGEFDLNNDGSPDRDGRQQIIDLINRWGGTVMDDITVNTDFLVIGTAPTLPPRPTQEEINIDPMAQQRFDQAEGLLQSYNQMLENADKLNVPVFNQKRFLYLIGYDTLINQNLEV